MNLADKIIEAKDEQSLPFSVDELGLPMPDKTNQEYIVARILSQKRNIYKIKGDLFVDGELVKPSVANVIWLNHGGDKYINGNTLTLIWRRLLECVHEFDRRYIRITDEIVWDREKSQLEYWYNRQNRGKKYE